MSDVITLTFDSKTLDYIANVLGQRPYLEAAPVLNSIAQQVQNQRLPQPITASANGGAGDPLPPLPQ